MGSERDIQPKARVRPMIRASLTDIAGGVLIAALGGVFAFSALGYPLGTLNNPGPGMFPLVLGSITAVIGLGVATKGLVAGTEKPVPIALRSVVSVSAAIAMFALLVRPFGLVPALFATVVVAAFGSTQSRPLPTIAVAAATSIGSWLIFIWGLGLPMPALRMPF